MVWFSGIARGSISVFGVGQCQRRVFSTGQEQQGPVSSFCCVWDLTFFFDTSSGMEECLQGYFFSLHEVVFVSSHVQLVRQLRRLMVTKEQEIEVLKSRMRKELDERLAEAVNEVEQVRQER